MSKHTPGPQEKARIIGMWLHNAGFPAYRDSCVVEHLITLGKRELNKLYKQARKEIDPECVMCEASISTKRMLKRLSTCSSKCQNEMIELINEYSQNKKEKAIKRNAAIAKAEGK